MTDTAITPMLDISSYRAMGSCKNRRVTITPESSNVVTGSTSTQDTYFSIPSGKYSLINPQGTYLQFDYYVAGTATAASVTAPPVPLGWKNGSAQSVIHTISVDIQSQNVENLDNYNVWAAIMDDFQANGRSKNVGSILQGTIYEDQTPSSMTDTAGAQVVQMTARQIKMPFNHTTGSSSVAVYRACIPLFSSTIGVLGETYLPAVDGIRLRITWESVLKSVFGATGTGYGLQNIKLQMDYIDVEPSAYMELAREGNGVLKSHMTGCANYETSVAAADTTQSILIPARFSSVKGLLNCWRNSATPTSILNTTGARLFPNLDYFNYNIGGRSFPSTQISTKTASGAYTGAESFQEVSRVFGQIHSPQFDIVFNSPQYLQSALANTDSAFVIGLCFEEFSGSSKVVSGLDTNSSNIYLQTSHAAVLTGPCLVDSFVLYDLIIEVDVATGAVSFSK